MLRRRGPSLLRTAAVAGVATATVKGVSGSMDAHAAQKQAAADQQAAQQQAAQQQQADMEQMKQQMAAMQAQQAQQAQMPQMAQQAPLPQPAAPAGGPDLMAQLTQLGQMKQAGLLSDEEFAAAKARLLGG